MQLVVDTNVLISALLARSKTYELIVLGDLELFAPEFSLEEIEKHSVELRGRMEVSKEEFNVALSLILSKVTVVNRSQYKQYEDRAKKICPDPKDFTFFALALAMRVPLWTNETRLKKQKDVMVYDTKDIIKLVYGG
ncbi:PIN domain-containing protein [Candidatus Micrarchaeota archaeon]|nr:PIN domain-containing protein [Candidatus Micrarchaeota archaeon]